MPKAKNFFEGLIKPFKFGSSSREGNNQDELRRLTAQEHKHFQYQTLVSATNDFSPFNKLGQGGFGSVYKGKLDDGREIAVKKLSQRSGQGDKEFVTEATLLARVQHRNIVTLLGYCAHGTEKLLVYEFVPNGSLDKHLFQSTKREQLDWKHRYDIITGIAKGIYYLHEESHSCIIHRDIKASNILLDNKWIPKVADFGMARLFPEDHTHVRTRVAGTSGYMAPEYVMHGHLSTKADVFSFGVLVLELVSAQRNSSFSKHDAQNLLDWAYKLQKKGRSLEIMDAALASSASPEQVKLCVHIALLCVQGDPQLRPNMQRVMTLLSRKLGNLEPPTRPGITGSRHRRSHRPQQGTSSTAGSSFDQSNSSSTDNLSLITATTASASSSALSRSDPHGKRPMQS